MKRLVIALIALLSAAPQAQQAVPEIPFDSVPNFLKRPPVIGQFRQPTDVAWDTEGNIYISDGYINSRVAKFTKDGDWVASLGEPGGGKLGNLNTPHTISYDAKGFIYVGDRGNRRIQVIDSKTNQFV